MAFWKMKNTRYIVVHSSATPSTMDIGAAEIDEWHKSKGWLGIGYHIVIRRDGSIEYGRSYNQIGAHAKGVNHMSRGICLVGGSDKDGKSEDNFTKEQMNSLKNVISFLQYAEPWLKVIGHRELLSANTTCPNFSIEKFRSEVLKQEIPDDERGLRGLGENKV